MGPQTLSGPRLRLGVRALSRRFGLKSSLALYELKAQIPSQFVNSFRLLSVSRFLQSVSVIPNPLSRALSPCFVFRPDTLVRASWRKVRPRPAQCVVRTAWGDSLQVEPHKFIGAHLYMRAVHELAVCEVLCRLAEPGEQVVDVGANIGVMTSLLSKRVGPHGRVFAFEPHPKIYRQLQQNVLRWQRSNVVALNWAASAETNRARLCETIDSERNEGVAALHSHAAASRSFEVRAVRLDDVLPCRDYGVLKNDVEGHEAEVIAGAEALLAKARIRDIIYESHQPASVHPLLQRFGYHVFGIEERLASPRLVEPGPAEQGQFTDFLATREPDRARKLISQRGWQVLRVQPIPF